MNAPDRFELFVLPEGVKKYLAHLPPPPLTHSFCRVAITPDTKMPNTSTFLVQKEDHTLGNLLARYVLSSHPIPLNSPHPAVRQMQHQQHVLFAGYKVPHPLDHSLVLKIQTDRTTTPMEALQRGVDQLIGDLSLLEERVKVLFGSQDRVPLMFRMSASKAPIIGIQPMSGQAPVPTDSAYSLPQMSSARRKPCDPNIVFQRTGQRTAPSSLSQFDFNSTSGYGNSSKERLRLLLDEPSSSRLAFATALVIALTIVTSALVAVIETVPVFYGNAREFWFYFESFILVIFSIEFLLRCYAHSTTWRQFLRFIFTFYTIVDLFAICPFLIKWAIYKGEIVDVHRFTVLRLFRLLRLFRCYTYSSLLQLSIDALILSVRKSIDALIALLAFLSFIMISFSTLIYFAERGTWDPEGHIFKDIDGLPTQFSSIPASLWFVTEVITTVGLGDVHPKTVLGKVITIPLMMLSLLIIALPSIVIGRNFSESWAWLRSTRPTRPSLHIGAPSTTNVCQHHHDSTAGPISPSNSANTNLSAPLEPRHAHAHFLTDLAGPPQPAMPPIERDRYPLSAPVSSIDEHGEVFLVILQELQRQNELLERLIMTNGHCQYQAAEAYNFGHQHRPPSPQSESNLGSV